MVGIRSIRRLSWGRCLLLSCAAGLFLVIASTLLSLKYELRDGEIVPSRVHEDAAQEGSGDVQPSVSPGSAADGKYRPLAEDGAESTENISSIEASESADEPEAASETPEVADEEGQGNKDKIEDSEGRLANLSDPAEVFDIRSTVKYVPLEVITVGYQKALQENPGFDWSKFAYAMYATDLIYSCNAVMALTKLYQNGAKPDLVLLFDESIYGAKLPKKKKQILELVNKAKENIPSLKLHPVRMGTWESADSTWAQSFNKFRAMELKEYERVMIFDADSIIIGNRTLDEYFFAPQARIAMPIAYWLSDIQETTVNTEENPDSKDKAAKDPVIESEENSGPVSDESDKSGESVEKGETGQNRTADSENSGKKESSGNHKQSSRKRDVQTPLTMTKKQRNESLIQPIVNAINKGDDYYELLPEMSNESLEKIVYNDQLILLQPSTSLYEELLELVAHKGENQYDMDLINDYLKPGAIAERVKKTMAESEVSTDVPVPEALVLPSLIVSGEFRATDHRRYLTDAHQYDSLISGKFATCERFNSSQIPYYCDWDAASIYGKVPLIHFSDYPIPKPWFGWQTSDDYMETIPVCYEGQAEEFIKEMNGVPEEKESETESSEPLPRLEERQEPGIGETPWRKRQLSRQLYQREEVLEDCKAAEIWHILYKEFRNRRKEVCGMELL